MSFRVYGNAGCPIVAFPTQDGMCDQWEGFGMVDVLQDRIENGEIQLFCLDTIDVQTWSNKYARKVWRAQRQENYFRFVIEEFLPFVSRLNDSGIPPLAVGCSLGAAHAANALLRRPDLFSGMIGLSGAYDARYFTNGWMNDLWRENSPVHFLRDLPSDDSRVKLLRNRTIVLCVGQGANEEIEMDATALLENALKEKNIDAWVDWWGKDVSHDWPWWKAQLSYFLPFALDEIKESSKNK